MLAIHTGSVIILILVSFINYILKKINAINKATSWTIVKNKFINQIFFVFTVVQDVADVVVDVIFLVFYEFV